LKIDVEGWELFVLQGGRTMIARDRPTVLIEREDHNMRRAGVTDAMLDAELDVLGYRCYMMGADNQWCVHASSTRDLSVVKRFGVNVETRRG